LRSVSSVRSGIIEWGSAAVKRLIVELPFSFVQLGTSRQCCIATGKTAGDMAMLDNFEAVGRNGRRVRNLVPGIAALPVARASLFSMFV
jgi:hypothetical protein